MKKNQLPALLFFVCAAFLSETALAENRAEGKTACEKWTREYHDAHCAYVLGLDSEGNEGRYLKHYDSEADSSSIRCVTANDAEDTISQDMAEYYIGSHTIEYSICSDAKGELCDTLGNDAYTIVKRGERYAGTPALYAIDLSVLKDQYPACHNAGTLAQQAAKKHQLK